MSKYELKMAGYLATCFAMGFIAGLVIPGWWCVMVLLLVPVARRIWLGPFNIKGDK